MNPLLLLVDLQADYLVAPGIEPPVATLIHQAGLLLRHCRSHGVPVAHVWTTVTRTPDNRMPHWAAAGRWLCEDGTAGHQPPASLQALPDEPVFHKTGFSAFTSPGLEQLLDANAVDTVIVAGLHLHACVREAVLGAYDRNRTVWVAEDATGSDDPVLAVATRHHLARRAATFLPASQIISHLQARTEPCIPGTPSSDNFSLPEPCDRALAIVPWKARAAGVLGLAADLESHASELAGMMADVIGKPVWHGEAELQRCATMLRMIAERAAQDRATNHGDPPEVRHRPLGTVAVITPWNNPFYIPLGKIIPALLYGNTVAWKPSPLVWPLALELSNRFAHHLPGLSAILTLVGGGRQGAERLLHHPGVDAVTLTGSLETGRVAADACARRHLPFQAELGGNNAAIVWEDADLSLAARQIADGAFAQAGQRCTANRRVIVAAPVLRDFMNHIQQAAADLPFGPPRSAQTRIGPMVTPTHRDRVAAVMERARTSGLELIPLHGDVAPDPSWGHAGAWISPALVICDDPDHEVVQQETFGPVLVVQTARDWDEAMRLLNGVHQGLAAALFTQSPDRISCFLDQARAGILKINQSTADAGLDLPFGGWKSSGCGPPEHGRFDREFFTRAQTVYGVPSHP